MKNLKIIAFIVVLCFAATTIAWSAPSVIATPPKAGEAISALAPASRFSEDIREESPPQITQFLRGLFVPAILLFVGTAVVGLSYYFGQNQFTPHTIRPLLYATVLVGGFTFSYLAPFASGGGSGRNRKFSELPNAEQRQRVVEAARDAAMNHPEEKATRTGIVSELGITLDEFFAWENKNLFNFKEKRFFDESPSPAAAPQRPITATPPKPPATAGTPNKPEPWANLLAAPTQPSPRPVPPPAFIPRPAPAPVIAPARLQSGGSPAKGRATSSREAHSQGPRPRGKRSPSVPKAAKPAAPVPAAPKPAAPPAPKPADKPAKYRQAQWKDLTPPKQKVRFSKAIKTMLQTGAQLTWPTIGAALGIEVIDVQRFAQKNNFNIETGKFEKAATKPKPAAKLVDKPAPPPPLTAEQKRWNKAKASIIEQFRDTKDANEKGKYRNFDCEVEVGRSGRLELYVGIDEDGNESRAVISTGAPEPGTARIRRYYDNDLKCYILETERTAKGKKISRAYLIELDEATGFNKITFVEKFREMLKRYLEGVDGPDKKGKHKKTTFEALATRSGKNANIKISVKDKKGRTQTVVLAAGKNPGVVTVTIGYDDDLECDVLSVRNEESNEIATSIKVYDEKRGINVFRSVDKYKTLLKRQLLDLDECNKEGKYECLGPFKVSLDQDGQYSICLVKEKDRELQVHLLTGTHKDGEAEFVMDYDRKRKWYLFKTKRKVDGKTITTTSVIGFNPMRGINDFFQIRKNGKLTGFGPPIVSIENLGLLPKRSARILIDRFNKIVTDAVASNSNVTIEAIQDMLLEARITAGSQRIKSVVEKLRSQPAPAVAEPFPTSADTGSSEETQPPAAPATNEEIARLTRRNAELEAQIGQLQAEIAAAVVPEPTVTASISTEQGISVAVAFEPPAPAPESSATTALSIEEEAVATSEAGAANASAAEVEAKALETEEAVESAKPPRKGIISLPEPALSAANGVARNDVPAISFDDFAKQLGARIKERREEEPGWSRKKLREVIKTQSGLTYSEARIAAIERGKNLTFAELYDCFNALEIPDDLDWLLGAARWRSYKQSVRKSRALGKRIRELREEKGWSQTEFAQEIQHTPGAICNVEAGRFITYPLLAKIESALDVNLLPFLFELKQPLPAPAPAALPDDEATRTSLLTPQSRFARPNGFSQKLATVLKIWLAAACLIAVLHPLIGAQAAEGFLHFKEARPILADSVVAVFFTAITDMQGQYLSDSPKKSLWQTAFLSCFAFILWGWQISFGFSWIETHLVSTWDKAVATTLLGFTLSLQPMALVWIFKSRIQKAGKDYCFINQIKKKIDIEIFERPLYLCTNYCIQSLFPFWIKPWAMMFVTFIVRPFSMCAQNQRSPFLNVIDRSRAVALSL